MSPDISSLYDQFSVSLLPQAIQVVIAASPVVLAVILALIFWQLWVDYVRSYFFNSLKYAVLEIKLPKETWKSPLAMEVFLTSLHNSADGGWYKQFWNGEVRPWYSLEMISIEGQVKFMIWTEDRRKTNLISALYSQFPGIEVQEVEDYTKSVHWDPTKIRIWGAEMMKTEDMVIPIRTYVEYGLDKDPKEEFKIDPLTPLLEFLGSAPPNTQLWVQILIRAHKKEQKKKGFLFAVTDTWKDEATKIINEIMLRNPKTKVSGLPNEKGFLEVPTLTKGEAEAVAALERTIYKKSFDVGIRTMYIAKKEQFDTVYGVGGFIGGFNQFGAALSNNLRPSKDRWHPQLEAPWQDFNNYRRNLYGKLILMAYKRRSYFYTPFARKPNVMNTEELATIFHFPGQVAQTPTLERVPSKKAQAPSNLPV